MDLGRVGGMEGEDAHVTEHVACTVKFSDNKENGITSSRAHQCQPEYYFLCYWNNSHDIILLELLAQQALFLGLDIEPRKNLNF